MRSHRSRLMTLLLIATVLAAAGGLLLMHGIASLSAAPPDRMAHAAADHAAMPDARSALLMSDHGPSMHVHELLDCVWVLVSGLVLLVAAAWVVARRRHPSASAGLLHRLCDQATRGPPTAVRLSLVGIARC